MEDYKNTPYASWEQDSFRTGSTRPPKKRGGLVAILLIAVILLCSVVGALGFMNIRLFSRLQKQPPSELTFHDHTALATEPAPATMPQIEDTVELLPTPEAPENTSTQEGLSLQEIYSKTIDSVVSISCTLQNGSSSGTGVV